MLSRVERCQLVSRGQDVPQRIASAHLAEDEERENIHGKADLDYDSPIVVAALSRDDTWVVDDRAAKAV